MSFERPEAHAITGRFWEKLASIAGAILHKASPDPRKFSDVIAPEIIEGDLNALERREQSFQGASDIEKQFLAMADVLEAIIFEQVEKNQWLGPYADIIKTARFDDVMNGVDAVIEFAPEGDRERAEHLALAIDVTFSGDVHRTKIDRVLAQIDAGSLAQVKYYDSPHEHGSIEAVEIILGIDRKHLAILAEEWAESMDAKNSRALATHPVRDMIIIQALEQCKALAAYAEYKNNPTAAARYTATRKLLWESLVTAGWKRRAIPEAYENDEVHEGILSALARLPKNPQPENGDGEKPKRRIIVAPKKP